MPVKFQPCPTTGNGVHNWLLSQANRCRNGGLAPEATTQCLREAVRDCGREVPDREIDAATEKAFASSGMSPGLLAVGVIARETTRKSFPSRVALNPDLIEAITASGLGLPNLWEASPILFTDEQSHAEEIIDTLFPGDPLLCAAKGTAGYAQTMPRSSWRGRLEFCSLVVPSPMSAPTGINLEGKVSKRCLDNTGPRRFLVVEFDSGTLDSQAARMLHLAQFSPLCLALHSGSKSLHGWFKVLGFPEMNVLKFFRYAVSLGADYHTWTPCQMVRIPDGLHKNGCRQTVFYFNPKLIESHVH
jgi:hypothetical protein